MGRLAVAVAAGAVVLGAGAAAWGWRGGAILEARVAEALSAMRAEIEASGGSFRHGAPSADPWRLRVEVPSPEASGSDGSAMGAERLVVSLAPWDAGLRFEELSASAEGMRLRARAAGGRPGADGSWGVLLGAWARDFEIVRDLAPGRRAMLVAREMRAERLSRAGGAEGVVGEGVELRQPASGRRAGGVVSLAGFEATRIGGEAPWRGAFRVAGRDAALRGGAGEVLAQEVLLEGRLEGEGAEGSMRLSEGRLPAAAAAGRPDRFALRSSWRLEGAALDLGLDVSFDAFAALRASVALRDLPAAAMAGGARTPEERIAAALAFSEVTLASASVEIRDLGGLPAWMASEGAGLRRWAETEGRASARGMPAADQAVRSAVAEFVRAPGGRALTVAATPPRPLTMEDLGRRVPFLLLGAGAGPLGLTAQVR